MARSFPFGTAIFLLCLGLSGCSEDAATTPGPVATFCQEGSVVCVGNATATCIESGKAYGVASCGESKYCAGGKCQAVICEKGKRSCSGNTVMACPDNGAADATAAQTCGGSTVCKAGVCVPASCTDGAKSCGWKTLLECKGGTYKETACGTGQVCNAASPKCVARQCVPGARQCLTSTAAQACNATGTAWVGQSCAAGQGCYDGVCHSLVVGKDPDSPDASTGKDVTAGDGTVQTDTPTTLDVPKKDIDWEPLDLFEVTISQTPDTTGQKIKFGFAGANYLSTIQMLQITGDEGLNKLELQIAKVDEYITGTFTMVGGEAPEANVLMNDGSNDQATLQWLYQASDYTIQIDEFGAPGGRVKGSFTAELTNALDNSLIYLNGSFDVARGS